MKLLFNFFISLCILLLSGYGQPDGHNQQKYTDYAFAQTIGTPGVAGFNAIQNNRAFDIHSDSSDSEKRRHRTHEKNIEEEYEPVPVKKYLKSSNSLTALFYALTFGHFFRYIKNSLFTGRHFVRFSAFCPLYIRFRVFRL
ncbi:hypothetical protein [Sinomicrobium weinanense]|uniref:Uncharacterized protein n=1 Tax=Sinomicrobium weinanense TaxID=2842200 RepID=A0A926Q4X0_9FLAO|nr:hypothetical protein [Sinomicrobium weinanense]MBC9797531.1 hypothetical protein [Sinomicrobium weinanense]MBU3122390.1 hypothetical protein [Sinomicrobium weinanense]